jgi:hypothetical protein
MTDKEKAIEAENNLRKLFNSGIRYIVKISVIDCKKIKQYAKQEYIPKQILTTPLFLIGITINKLKAEILKILEEVIKND